MSIGSLVKWGVALGLLALSFVNASWIAPDPAGAVQLVAAKNGKDGCASLDSTRRALIAAGGGVVLDTDSAPGCLSAQIALEQFPRYNFILKVTDAAKALAIFDALDRPVNGQYGFMGTPEAIAAIRASRPDAWAWTVSEARTCFADYVKLGWFALIPQSCKGRTILVPLDEKWKVAGWPKRFLARMKAAGTHVILTGPGKPADTVPGLNALEQIPQVPRDFDGRLWLDNAELIGPSIRP